MIVSYAFHDAAVLAHDGFAEEHCGLAVSPCGLQRVVEFRERMSVNLDSLPSVSLPEFANVAGHDVFAST